MSLRQELIKLDPELMREAFYSTVQRLGRSVDEAMDLNDGLAKYYAALEQLSHQTQYYFELENGFSPYDARLIGAGVFLGFCVLKELAERSEFDFDALDFDQAT